MGYYEFRDRFVQCSGCGWQGQGREASILLATLDVIEHACPGCAQILVSSAVPSLSETEQHVHELSADELRLFERSERAHQQYLQAVLRDPEQLPDLEGDALEFIWDHVEDEGAYSIVLRIGERELWREPAYFECYRRFGELLAILTSKYGTRVKDLAPTSRSLLYLYGESFIGPEFVRASREKLMR